MADFSKNKIELGRLGKEDSPVIVASGMDQIQGKARSSFLDWDKDWILNPKRRDEFFLALANFYGRRDILSLLSIWDNKSVSPDEVRKDVFERIWDSSRIVSQKEDAPSELFEKTGASGVLYAKLGHHLVDQETDYKTRNRQEDRLGEKTTDIAKMTDSAIEVFTTKPREKIKAMERVIHDFEKAIAESSRIWGQMREMIMVPYGTDHDMGNPLQLPDDIKNVVLTCEVRLRKGTNLDEKRFIINEFLNEYYRLLHTKYSKAQLEKGAITPLQFDLARSPLRFLGVVFESQSKKMDEFQEGVGLFLERFAGFFHLSLDHDNDEPGKTYNGHVIKKKATSDSSREEIHFKVSTHEKTRLRITQKQLSRIEVDALSAVKDRVGFRIEVERGDLVDLMKIVWRHLGTRLIHCEDCEFMPTIIESNNTISLDDLQNMVGTKSEVKVEFDDKKDFEDIRIYGTVTKKGKTIPWEIQIVPSGNSNEAWISHHDAYKRIQLLPATMRHLKHGIPRQLLFHTILEACHQAEANNAISIPRGTDGANRKQIRKNFRNDLLEKKVAPLNLFYDSEAQSYFLSEQRDDFIPKYKYDEEVMKKSASFQKVDIGGLIQSINSVWSGFAKGSSFPGVSAFTE